MRPVQLTMCAFSSYGKKTTIDFRIPNQNLFLITGNTGAGKSTIFDAIVFALYGETSSGENKKTGVELQSQFSDLHTTPYVELVFSERAENNEDIYRVKRIPRHRRAARRKSAEGVVDVKEEVVLKLPDESVFNGSIREVNARLEEIVGLTKEQFMQVAMIAQGEFWDLLRASSDEKKKIFRKLFRTELYEALVNEIGQRAKDGQALLEQLLQSCKHTAGRLRFLDIQDETDRGVRMEKEREMNLLQQRILAGKQISLVDVEAFATGLEELIPLYQQYASDSSKKYVQTGEKRDQLRDFYAEAVNLKELFEKREQAEQELQGYQRQEEKMQAQMQLVSWLDQAFLLKEKEDRAEEAENQLKGAREMRDSYQKRLPLCLEGKETAKKAYSRAEQAHRLVLTAYAGRNADIQRTLDAFDQMEQLQKQFSKARDDYQEAVKKQEMAESLLMKSEGALEQMNRAAEKGSSLTLERERWKHRAEKLSDQRTAMDASMRLIGSLENQCLEIEKNERLYEASRDSYRERAVLLQEAEQYFLDAQAGLLASTSLKPGKPCPVCGSTEHPMPCRLPEKIVTKEELDLIRRETEEIRGRAEETSKKLGQLRERLAGGKSELEKQYTIFHEFQRAYPEKAAPAQLREFFTELSGALSLNETKHGQEGEALTKEEKRLEQLLKERGLLEVQIAEQRQAVEIWKKQAEASKILLTEVQQSWKLQKEHLLFPTKEEARAALQDEERKKLVSEKALQEEHQKYLAFVREAEQLMTVVSRLEKEIPDQEAEARQRKSVFEELLRKSGLESAHYHQLLQQYKREDLERFRKEAERFRENMRSAKRLADSLNETIKGRVLPDMEELDRQILLAEQEKEKWERICAGVRENLKNSQEVFQEITGRLKERSEGLGRVQKLISLYQRLGGKVTNARMDMETYVQRYYLRRILSEANRHFGRMTGGQYHLCMVDPETAGIGKNHGLDLMVYSALTGQTREVRTLSGGESFMAALALALGLAGLIREKISAIGLDVMFVDEGFGSLDDNVRDQAIKVLRSVAGNDRMIGIISHVTEIKQGIEDQLVIEKDRYGSKAYWQIS